MESLANVVEPGLARERFPVYLKSLAAHDPATLRNRLLYWRIHSPSWRIFYDSILLPEPEVAEVLADPESAIRFFEERGREKFDQAIMQELFVLLRNPEAFQTTLVEHLGWLWENAVEAEWQRISPLLEESVAAFQPVNLSGLTILEAIQAVTGRDLRTLFRLETLLRYPRIRFIPTLHNGPYILWFGDDEELRMTYLARRPEQTADRLSPLDQGELSSRLAALADETRLQILFALDEAGELSTQEIIDRFDLNKSAASRHLRQLYANNLLLERRADGAKKVYMLNRRTVQETIRRLEGLARSDR
jgi:DNA-binding transcriptional ArsR family regulator